MINTLYYENRLAYLQEEILKAEHKLETFPEGRLVIYHNGNSFKYYQHIGSSNTKATRKYIPKSDIAFARKLAHKALLKSQLADMKNEALAIQRYLSTRRKCKTDHLFSPNSVYSTLLSQETNSNNNDHVKPVAPHPENLIIPAPKGQFVRSKSEAIIAHALFQNHVDYQYELPIYFGNTILHPDFTIHHTRTGEKYLWEHFGLVDNNFYQANMFNKMSIYISNGFIPGKNLILTYETKASPINIEYIQTLIDFHFLNY